MWGLPQGPKESGQRLELFMPAGNGIKTRSEASPADGPGVSRKCNRLIAQTFFGQATDSKARSRRRTTGDPESHGSSVPADTLTRSANV